MSTLYLDDQGAVIRVSGQEFIICTGDRERERIPRTWVERVVIAGNVQISTQALTMLLKEEIPVAFMSTKGNYRGSLHQPSHKHAALRIAQYDCSRDHDFKLRQGRVVLEAKLKNCRSLLLKHRRAHPEFHCDMEIEGISRERHKLKQCPTMEGLMGHEGVAAHWYFTAFGRMVRREFAFEHRSRRPPRDPVNAMLSLGYTLLYNDCLTAVEAIGLDGNIGFLHALEYGRASLASDMVEEFRWLIDGMVLGIVNRGMVHPDDFTPQEDGGYRMGDPARKMFYGQYEERMRAETTDRDTQVCYRRLLFRQAEQLARVIQGEESDYLPHLIQ